MLDLGLTDLGRQGSQAAKAGLAPTMFPVEPSLVPFDSRLRGMPGRISTLGVMTTAG